MSMGKMLRTTRTLHSPCLADASGLWMTVPSGIIRRMSGRHRFSLPGRMQQEGKRRFTMHTLPYPGNPPLGPLGALTKVSTLRRLPSQHEQQAVCGFISALLSSKGHTCTKRTLIHVLGVLMRPRPSVRVEILLRLAVLPPGHEQRPFPRAHVHTQKPVLFLFPLRYLPAHSGRKSTGCLVRSGNTKMCDFEWVLVKMTLS